MRTCHRWLVAVLAVPLLGALGGCSREAADDTPPADPKAAPAVKKVEPADCCEIDRATLLARAGGETKASGKVGSDSPMFGGTPARNMVNPLDKGILTDWN